MRSRFDQLAKQLATAYLEGCGDTRTDEEVLTDSQHIDIWHVPSPEAVERRARLGLFGRMMAEACLLEPFHHPPDTDDVLECLRKHLTFHRARVNKARAATTGPAVVSLATCWIVSSGRPAASLEALGFAAVPGWPTGTCAAPPGFRLQMVVLTELPCTRDTLLVRLLGRGAVLRNAMRDLLALPPDSWERTAALPPLIRLRFELPDDPHDRTTDEEEFAVTAQELMDSFEQKAIERGIEQGIEKGIRSLVHLFERRLGRPLRDDERACIQERNGRLGPDRVGDVVLDLSPEALAVWLADPSAR